MGESSTTTGPDGDSTSVLIVDDYQEWAELVAARVEGATQEMSVQVAANANETMVTLREDGEIDCLVTDYQMPTVDGIELAERVREEYPDLPILLMTGEGSEHVAARAMESGVTDYIVKDPNGDQTTEFVNKIRAAVEQARLRQQIAASEQRYRTVTEQSSDAIAIVQDGQVVFHNQRLGELAGRDSLDAGDIIDTIVHPDDQSRVASILDCWTEYTEDGSVHEMRIVQPDETVRYCEYTGSLIDYDCEQAILLSIRDVTDRRQHERELEWERELNRTLQEELVTARTRDDLEAAITTQLLAQGYAMAWVGERSDDALSPRICAGEETYIDAVDWTLDSSENTTEPCIRATRSGEPQFLGNFADLFPTPWREHASEHGYQSGGGLPLRYNDISYGVLGVYHEQPDRFDDTERRLLTELAETVAFAIHSIETETALAANETVEATVQIESDDYYLVALAQDGVFIDCDSVEVRGTVPQTDTRANQYLTATGCEAEPLVDQLVDHRAVGDVVVISERDPVRLQLTVTEQVPERELAAQGVTVHSTRLDTTGATITVELPAKADLRATVETLQTQFDSAAVTSVVEQPAAESARTELTAKQATALEAAYHHGYFEQPRGGSATQIAESLDISHSTFLQHLRTAQQKLFTRRFN